MRPAAARSATLAPAPSGRPPGRGTVPGGRDAIPPTQLATASATAGGSRRHHHSRTTLRMDKRHSAWIWDIGRGQGRVERPGPRPRAQAGRLGAVPAVVGSVCRMREALTGDGPTCLRHGRRPLSLALSGPVSWGGDALRTDMSTTQNSWSRRASLGELYITAGWAVNVGFGSSLSISSGRCDRPVLRAR